MSLRVSIVLSGLFLPHLDGALGTRTVSRLPGQPFSWRSDEQDETGCGTRKLQKFYLTGAEPKRYRAYTEPSFSPRPFAVCSLPGPALQELGLDIQHSYGLHIETICKLMYVCT